MGQSILKRDKEGVLSVWELQGKPYWSIWEYKKEPSFSCNADTEEERRAMLEQYLDMMKDSLSSQQFTIKFHNELGRGGTINNNTPVIGSLNFRLNDSSTETGVARVAGGGNETYLREIFDLRMERLEDKYIQKLEDLKREHEEQLADLEEANSNTREMGQIGEIGDLVGSLGTKYPWMQHAINKVVDSVTSFFNNNPAHAAGIAGIENTMQPYTEAMDTTTIEEGVKQYQERMNSSITALENFYVAGNNTTPEGRLQGFNNLAADMQKLAKMAQDNPKKLKSLLAFL